MLPIDTCQFWFDALATDDVLTVASTLESAEPREKNVLLNGYFDFKDEHFSQFKRREMVPHADATERGAVL